MVLFTLVSVATSDVEVVSDSVESSPSPKRPSALNAEDGASVIRKRIAFVALGVVREERC